MEYLLLNWGWDESGEGSQYSLNDGLGCGNFFVTEEERKQAAVLSFWCGVLWNYVKPLEPGGLCLGILVRCPDLWTSFIGFDFDLHWYEDLHLEEISTGNQL